MLIFLSLKLTINKKEKEKTLLSF